LATGRILQFDPARGYGFVAADDSGEDVFLHASVFDGDPGMLVPGKKVRFQIMAGDRGRKAFAVQLVADDPNPDDKSAQSATAPPRAVPAPSAQVSPAPSAAASPAPPPTPASPVPSAPAPSAAVKPAPALAAQVLPVPDEEQMCDVLSPPEFRQELTELLLNTVPELTGQQILQARQGMLEFAKEHGWIDG
jgi:cold shock protein